MAGIDPTDTKETATGGRGRGRLGALAAVILLSTSVVPAASAALLDPSVGASITVGGTTVDSDALLHHVGTVAARSVDALVPSKAAPGPAAPAATEGAADGEGSAPDASGGAAEAGAAADLAILDLSAWGLKIALIAAATALGAVAADASRSRWARAVVVGACLVVGVLDLALTTVAYRHGSPAGAAWLAATVVVWALLLLAARRLASRRRPDLGKLDAALDAAHLEARVRRAARRAVLHHCLVAEIEATRRARRTLGGRDEP